MIRSGLGKSRDKKRHADGYEEVNELKSLATNSSKCLQDGVCVA